MCPRALPQTRLCPCSLQEKAVQQQRPSATKRKAVEGVVSPPERPPWLLWRPHCAVIPAQPARLPAEHLPCARGCPGQALWGLSTVSVVARLCSPVRPVWSACWPLRPQLSLEPLASGQACREVVLGRLCKRILSPALGSDSHSQHCQVPLPGQGLSWDRGSRGPGPPRARHSLDFGG